MPDTPRIRDAATHPDVLPGGLTPDRRIPINLETGLWVLRALMVLVALYSAVASYSLWQAEQSFLVRGQRVCAVLESAHTSTRTAGLTQYQAMPGAARAWSVDARYTYQLGGRTYASRGVWPWGPGGDEQLVQQTVLALQTQQQSQGCVDATVDASAPGKAVLFASTASEMRSWWLRTPMYAFLALLGLHLAGQGLLRRRA